MWRALLIFMALMMIGLIVYVSLGVIKIFLFCVMAFVFIYACVKLYMWGKKLKAKFFKPKAK